MLKSSMAVGFLEYEKAIKVMSSQSHLKKKTLGTSKQHLLVWTLIHLHHLTGKTRFVLHLREEAERWTSQRQNSSGHRWNTAPTIRWRNWLQREGELYCEVTPWDTQSGQFLREPRQWLPAATGKRRHFYKGNLMGNPALLARCWATQPCDLHCWRSAVYKNVWSMSRQKINYVLLASSHFKVYELLTIKT